MTGPGGRRVRPVFFALMLALLPAALEQIIVAAAPPVIVGEPHGPGPDGAFRCVDQVAGGGRTERDPCLGHEDRTGRRALRDVRRTPARTGETNSRIAAHADRRAPYGGGCGTDLA